MLYFFMIKNLILTSMLLVMPTNTIITNTVSRTAYVENTSEWLMDQTTVLNDCYRNKTYNLIQNDSFTLKQRSIEHYMLDLSEGSEQAVNEYYYLANINATNIETLKNINLEIPGNINPQWFASGQIQYYKLENTDVETTAIIENFLNGNEINTIANYSTTIGYIENLFSSSYEYTNLTQQNVYTILNHNIHNTIATDPCNYFTFMVKIYIEMGTNWDTYPLTEPYTPFNNLGYETQTQVEYTADINTGGTGEIVDIPGLLFSILGMPFTFLSQAFNLTIFPGTVYAVNISHIFLAVIGAGILIFVIKRILK